MAIETSQRISVRRIKALRLSSLLHRGAWGLGDQAFISATNFVTTVVLARALGPASYGAFALVYAAIFFASALQSALVTRPHNVIGATYSGADYRRYSSATAMSQIWLIGVLALIVSIAALLAHGATWSIAPLLLPLLPAIIAWQLQEFFRRVLYTEGRLKLAFLNDVVSYGAQAIGIIALAHYGRLTGARALYIVALTSAVAAVLGLWMIRESLDRREMGHPTRGQWLAENWRFGKWIFAAIVVAASSSQLYTALIGGLVSVAEAGVFRALITIFGPARILLTAMETSLTPAAARVFAEKGQPGLHSFIVRVMAITAPIMAAYGILVSLFATPILGTLLGDQYRQYGWLLALLALSYVLMYLLSPVVIALEGRRISAPVFYAGLWSGAIGLTVGIAAIHLFGLLGAVLGMILDLLISNTILWRRYRRIAATTMPEAIQ
ncbi:MAG: oligosaccharide flippase family protein [Thermomicrobiales bacterium]